MRRPGARVVGPRRVYTTYQGNDILPDLASFGGDVVAVIHFEVSHSPAGTVSLRYKVHGEADVVNLELPGIAVRGFLLPKVPGNSRRVSNRTADARFSSTSPQRRPLRPSGCPIASHRRGGAGGGVGRQGDPRGGRGAPRTDPWSCTARAASPTDTSEDRRFGYSRLPPAALARNKLLRLPAWGRAAPHCPRAPSASPPIGVDKSR